MSANNPIVTRPAAELVEASAYSEPPAPPAKPPNPLLVIHALLRGRYPLAIGLAILGAALCAPLGYLLVKPEYKSTGVVEVRATLPRVLYETEQNERIPDFGPFLLTQVELLKSSRVVGLAMQDPEWVALGRGLEPEQIRRFNQSLNVTSPRNSQLIYVQFSDRDAKVAATAVKAMIRAYEQVFVDVTIGSGAPLMQALESLRRQQTQALKGIGDRIQAMAGEFDAASLEPIYDARLRLWLEAEVQRKQAEVAASLRAVGGPAAAPATAPSSAPTPGAASPDAPGVADVAAAAAGADGAAPDAQTLEQLFQAARRADPFLQEYEREYASGDRELRGLKLQFGENHPKVAQAQVRLTTIQQDIDARVEELRKLVAERGTAAPLPGDVGGLPGADLNPAAAVDVWRRTAAAYKAELDELAARKRQVDDLRYEERTARDLLEATRNRIQQLTVESGKFGDRLSILSSGDVPLSPEKDRRTALTALGAAGGAGLGVGIVLLLGYLDRRIRHVDSTRAAVPAADRLLGIMPEMAGGVIDTENANAAAFCVHHIRAMLQIRQRASGHRLIGVTSPAPGDGKTTLVISLGMSLASTGARTLVVDCDFDGGGLSSRLRRLIERRANAPSTAGGGEGNGTAGMQLARPAGLRAALDGAPLEEVILPTGYKNLSLLPLGMQPGAQAGQLSPEVLHRLFSRLAMNFDTILIDTGPILGSVEASIVAAEVDSMILVVSRDGDRSDAENASEMLTNAGAQVEGIVFNRALDADVERSMYRSYISGRSVRRSVPEAGPSNGAASSSNGQGGPDKPANEPPGK